MAHYDLIISNGTVATADQVRQCDIAVKDGLIAALGTDLGSADRTIDATGKIVVPGGIDSHVHISQPSGDGIVMADDFESGTLSAVCGGTTTILPFALQQKGQSLRDVVKAYHALADGKCHADVSFHLIVSDPTPQVLGQDLPALVADGYTSFKVFMTYEGLKLNDREILETMDVARETGALVMVHCENEDAIRFLIDRHVARGDVEPRHHASTRPAIAEREATHRAISLAEIIETPVVIVHVSNRQAMDEIARARSRGRPVVGETCPQYLVLTADDLDKTNWEGAKFVCSPPPRDTDSQIACWEGIEGGVFDLFSSDHCPFRYDDEAGKLNARGRTDFRWIPNGIPGVETRLPILFSEGVSKGRISLERFVALGSTNHAKTYGLYPQKGQIAEGSDADLVIWDPELERPISQERLHHGADYTPYEGLMIKGWPVEVILRGTQVVAGGEPTGAAPGGRHLARGKSALVTEQERRA
ncbi:dihydropyrimidinase [Arsenicitalea aurantiaca]|uniref:Dihydropyrimidinase n=1 Tax=Arsenicitalea aurantiaca TaxID=1783274 RepID=A0A433XED8_9HYPH|nr:dihydropyrimidinase [Arsenicitalea aurantiaca]RUT32463.1 dihydropyrimidinase [Arsenicitalea aurantiaca]